MAMVGTTLPVSLKPYLMARTSFRSRGRPGACSNKPRASRPSGNTSSQRLAEDGRVDPGPVIPRLAQGVPGDDERAVRPEFAYLVIGAARATDVLPEATGMLPARWLAGAVRDPGSVGGR